MRIQSAEGPKGEACTIDLSSFVALYEWEAYGDGAIGGAPPVADRPKWVSMLKSEEGGQTRCSGGCGGGTVSECCRVLIGSEAQ